MAAYTGEEIHALGLKRETLPAHVAIIMDGNGRWAKRRLLPRSLGHRAGVDRLRGIIRLSSDLGIRALTLYAFSTENWRRPSDEVGTLMGLLIEYFEKEIDELHANAVCIRAIGELESLPAQVRSAVQRACERTCGNGGLRLNIALSYGGRAEILRAANEAARAAAAAGQAEITPALFESFLYTNGLPEVDLLIRTSGEQRISNFLLYQISYAELIFTDALWPDFTNERYVETLAEYARRSRRYGGLEDEA